MADFISQLPGIGALWAGQNQALSQQKQGLDNNYLQTQIQELTQKMQQEQAMNPEKIRRAQLENQGLEAGLPGIVATSDQKQTEARKLRETADSDIDYTKFTNSLKKDEESTKALDRASRRFTALASQVGQVPPLLRNQWITQAMGPDMNPQILTMMQNIPPEQLPGVLSKIANTTTELSGSYKQAMDVAKEQSAKTVEAAKIHAGATVQAAQIGADSRMAVASAKNKATDIITQVQSGKLPPDKAAVMFDTMAELAPADDPNKALYRQQAMKMENFAMNLKRAGAEGKPDLNKMGIETQTVPPALSATSAAPPKQVIKTLPQGAKQIGTSGGKPVFQTPDGKKFIGE